MTSSRTWGEFFDLHCGGGTRWRPFRFRPPSWMTSNRKWGHPRWRPEAEGPPSCAAAAMGIEKLALYYSYPTADESTRGSMAVTSFIAALGSEAQQLFVYQKDPKNLEEASCAALGYETFQASVSKEVRVVRTQQVEKDSEEPPKWARDWMSKMERQLTYRRWRSVYVPWNAQQVMVGQDVSWASFASIVDNKGTLLESAQLFLMLSLWCKVRRQSKIVRVSQPESRSRWAQMLQQALSRETRNSCCPGPGIGSLQVWRTIDGGPWSGDRRDRESVSPFDYCRHFSVGFAGHSFHD